jgi:hypothetical protein
VLEHLTSLSEDLSTKMPGKGLSMPER